MQLFADRKMTGTTIMRISKSLQICLRTTACISRGHWKMKGVNVALLVLGCFVLHTAFQSTRTNDFDYSNVHVNSQRLRNADAVQANPTPNPDDANQLNRPAKEEAIRLSKTHYNNSNNVTKFDMKDCPKLEADANPREFFIFRRSNLVWCNVFKAASTSIFHLMAKIDHLPQAARSQMKGKPAITIMRHYYDRPSLDELGEALQKPGAKVFVVKRHPVKRLISGYEDKILHALKGTYHDKMARDILFKYRDFPKKLYRKARIKPTFAEFLNHVLDEYEEEGTVDMHWAPIVPFCSMNKVNFTHILEFDHFENDFRQMFSNSDLPPEIDDGHRFILPRKNKRKKVNPLNQEEYSSYVDSLDWKLRQRLARMYCQDFQMLNYSVPWEE